MTRRTMLERLLDDTDEGVWALVAVAALAGALLLTLLLLAQGTAVPHV